MFQSNLPTQFWSYAIKHAIHLINRVPSPINWNKTPYELLHKEPPEFSMLKVFGCLCYASTHVDHRHKFDPRSRRGVFLGFQNGTKGYVILDLDTNEIFVSRHVVFHETLMPFSKDFHQHKAIISRPTGPITPQPETTFPSTSPNAPCQANTPEPNSNLSQPETSLPNPLSPSSSYSAPDITAPTHHLQPTDTITINPQLPSPPLRRSTRPHKPPSHLADYLCTLSSEQSSISSSRCSHPLQSVLSYSRISPSHQHYIMSLSSELEPASYQEATQHPCWRDAMKAEIEALELNKTWHIVTVPPHVKPIGYKWVYKIKRRPDGSVERYKARLVAKGFAQVEGIDYFEIFSPVVKMATIRVVLALASINRWHLHQLDVSNAFLHGDLSEDVYMVIPPGVNGSRSSQCCKLLKSLYGLKQASRKWYEKLSILLLSCGYQQAQADHSLFLKIEKSAFTALIVYVDDIVLAGNSIEEMNNIKRILHSNFRIKDLGILKYFLGLEVAHSDTGISLCQRKYCLDLLHDSGMLGSKPLSTPMDNSLRLHQDSSDLLTDVLSYRRLVGRLLYLTSTRPDIVFATQQLSQFMANPTQVHFRAATRILRYLKGCPGKGLLFRRNSPIQILAFSDADWATCIDSRKSVTGYCFFLGSSLVSWKTKKQSTVSRSSSEAEYRALASTTCELQWLTFLLNDLCVSCSKPAVLYCDNQSALHIAANPVFHERTKHLDIDCHIVREKSQTGLMRLLPISSHNQLADIFTKALPPRLFNSNLSKLGLVNIFLPPACWGVSKEEPNSNQQAQSENHSAAHIRISENDRVQSKKTFDNS